MTCIAASLAFLAFATWPLAANAQSADSTALACNVFFTRDRDDRDTQVSLCTDQGYILPASREEFMDIIDTGTIPGSRMLFWTDTTRQGDGTYQFTTTGTTVVDNSGTTLTGNAQQCVAYDRENNDFVMRDCDSNTNLICFTDSSMVIPFTSACGGTAVEAAGDCNIFHIRDRDTQPEQVSLCTDQGFILPATRQQFQDILSTGTVGNSRMLFWTDAVRQGDGTFQFPTTGAQVMNNAGNTVTASDIYCVAYDRASDDFVIRECRTRANLVCFTDGGLAIPDTNACGGGAGSGGVPSTGEDAAAACDIFHITSRGSQSSQVSMCTSNGFPVPGTIQEFQDLLATGTVSSSRRNLWLDTVYNPSTQQFTLTGTSTVVVGADGNPVEGGNSNQCAVYSVRDADIFRRDCDSSANIACFMNSDKSVNTDCDSMGGSMMPAVPFCQGNDAILFGGGVYCVAQDNIRAQADAVTFCANEGGVIIQERSDFEAATADPPTGQRFWTTAMLSGDGSNYEFSTDSSAVTLDSGAELAGDADNECVMWSIRDDPSGEFEVSECDNVNRRVICIESS